MRRKLGDLDAAATINSDRWIKGCQKFDRLQRIAGEARIVGRHCAHQILPKVDFTAFDLRGGGRPAHHFCQLHLHLRESLRVANRKSGKRALDHLRG